MIQSFLSTLKEQATNDSISTRRSHSRRHDDQCVLTAYGQTFPVDDWSLGGLKIVGDDRLFGIGQDLQFTVKFKLRNTILNVNHRGTVIRKNNNKVAIRFEPVTKTIQRYFQQVIDDSVAREFANSQAT